MGFPSDEPHQISAILQAVPSEQTLAPAQITIRHSKGWRGSAWHTSLMIVGLMPGLPVLTENCCKKLLEQSAVAL